MQMKKIMILNGPNMNMLGRREPEIYGHETLEDIRSNCERQAEALGVSIDFRQSNHEGELVDWVQQALDRIDGLIINAGAYTHTSLALHDALKILDVPIIELHISDPKQREEFRHHSFIAPVAAKVIAGQGAKGYEAALAAIVEICK